MKEFSCGDVVQRAVARVDARSSAATRDGRRIPNDVLVRVTLRHLHTSPAT